MLGAEAREANKAWLMQQVNHVLEPLMLELVKEKPTNTVSSSRRDAFQTHQLMTARTRWLTLLAKACV